MAFCVFSIVLKGDVGEFWRLWKRDLLSFVWWYLYFSLHFTSFSVTMVKVQDCISIGYIKLMFIFIANSCLSWFRPHQNFAQRQADHEKQPHQLPCCFLQNLKNDHIAAARFVAEWEKVPHQLLSFFFFFFSSQFEKSLINCSAISCRRLKKKLQVLSVFVCLFFCFFLGEGG